MIQSLTASRGYFVSLSPILFKSSQIHSSLFNYFQVFLSLPKSFWVFSSPFKSIQVFSNFGNIISKAFWQCHCQGFLAMSLPRLCGNVIAKALWQCHFQSFLAMSLPKLLTKVPDPSQQEQQDQEQASKSFLRPRYTTLLAVKNRFLVNSWKSESNKGSRFWHNYCQKTFFWQIWQCWHVFRGINRNIC